MDMLLESVRMMASFKDKTKEPGCFLTEAIDVNNPTFGVELLSSFFSEEPCSFILSINVCSESQISLQHSK